jgi:ATP-dependent exoDNAse (exonuclease V) beta subunit
MNSVENVLPLKIFNASAGSGKTYTLVMEYLLLILEEKNDSKRFAKIMAMTFTNKAALEMKSRILETLDLLSYPEIHGHATLEYIKNLQKKTSLSAEEICKRSKIILQEILHNYEDFHVMTIDKFNLRLIRSFSRDLDLPNDFDIVLNESEVIEQVVDILLNQLGKDHVRSLTELVLSYAKNNLDEGERWNFRNQLIEFGKVLNNEKDQHIIKKLIQLDFSVERLKTLKQETKSVKNQFLAKCQEVFSQYDKLNLTISLLPQGSRMANAIENLGKLADLPPNELFINSVIKVLKEKTPPKKVFPEELKNSMRDLNTYYFTIKSNYFLQVYFLRNYFNMALLQYLAKSIDTLKKDEQLLRISEFNKLISELVQNEIAPFIYERLGTRFKHFLLDEFQDTSRLQWLNMIPLFRESISNNNPNLIVGDPKQSIYRFKNGLAEQFVALPGIYNPENDPNIKENSDYFEKNGFLDDLKENWRSAPEIVSFNNEFFQVLKPLLNPDQQEFYNAIHQKNGKDFPGFVKISSKKVDKEEEKYLLDKVVDYIQECIADNFQLGDICILSETNSKASKWAVDLTKRGFKIVSSDSLLVHNELKVKLAHAYLKRRLNPSSQNELKRFAELFFRITQPEKINEYRSYFEKVVKNEKEYITFNEERFLFDHFGGRNIYFKKYESLYDLLSYFFQLMNWDELKNPYLHQFADFTHDYEVKKGSDLKSFLDYYKTQKGKLAIQIPSSKDAINLMTIHKSKGLEFPIVILPDINFDISIKTTAKFLVEINELILYTNLPKVHPIDEVSFYQNNEALQVFMDKVNLCYVGFTRAKTRLYVINHFSGNDFGKKAHECFEKMSTASYCESDGIQITIGNRSFKEQKEKDKEIINFQPESVTDRLWFPDIAFQDDESLLDSNLLTEEQRYGNQFHFALSQINDDTQIETTLERLVLSGELEKEFENRIKDALIRLFDLKEYQKLLEGAKEIMSEQALIISDSSTVRTDKIIIKENETILIDFKTGIPKPSDIKQMNVYIEALRKMEFANVKAFIYYALKHELSQIF